MSTPWSLFQFYPRTSAGIARHFLTEAYEKKHEYSEEEKKLHEYRNRIQEYEDRLPHGKNWEYYKKAVNPYEWVYTQKKYMCFPDSVCLLKPLSRSYFKMIEILELSRFFDGFPSNSIIRTAHVCEGPGGFIEAIYDEASRGDYRCPLSMAMTLRSRHSHVPSWKRASQFLKRNRSVQIVYGHDGSGDILKPENQQAFIDQLGIESAQQKADLFTADGGFDVSDHYEKQESLMFPLLVASTKIGLEVLRRGGMFVLKVFDCYHRATVDLIYFLSCHFEQWTLYKPCMSRPCNPEHYFVGKGFLGCTEEVLDVMRLWCLILENHELLEGLFQEGYVYDPLFMEWMEKHRTNAFSTQMEYLEKVFGMIDRECLGRELMREELEENYRHSVEWCQRFRMPTSYPVLVPSHSSVVELQSDLPVLYLPQ